MPTLYAYYQVNPKPQKLYKLDHVYWGRDIDSNSSILKQLMQWQDFLAFEKLPNIGWQTAELLASGHVIGWVQGRSEFAPEL